MDMNKALAKLEELSMDRRRGCWELLWEVLKVLSEACKEGAIGVKDTLAHALYKINPSMSVFEALAKSISDASDPCMVVETWRNYVARSRELLIKRAIEFIANRVVVTISHSSAVRESIIRARPKRVIILESRPGTEALDLYRALRDALDVEVEIVPDTYIARVVEKADVVVTGADAISIDGFVLNKVGTRALSIVAKYFGKPFIVLAESMKLTRYSCRDLEDRVSWSYSIGSNIVDVRVFECVEPNNISFIVTDKGVYRPFKELLKKVLSDVEEELRAR